MEPSKAEFSPAFGLPNIAPVGGAIADTSETRFSMEVSSNTERTLYTVMAQHVSPMTAHFLPFYLGLAITLAAWLPVSVCSGEQPLSRTELYTKTATGCRTLTIHSWKHQTKHVMEKHGVDLHTLELCNRDTFPIFTVKLPYDPLAQTDSYFNPLYYDMLTANGKWPFALVDYEDAVIIQIMPLASGNRGVDISYEKFDNVIN